MANPIEAPAEPDRWPGAAPLKARIVFLSAVMRHPVHTHKVSSSIRWAMTCMEPEALARAWGEGMEDNSAEGFRLAGPVQFLVVEASDITAAMDQLFPLHPGRAVV